MAQSFVEQMNHIFDNSILSLREKIEQTGQIPEDFNFPVIDISHLEVNFQHPIKYITEDFIVDTDGYHYSFQTLDLEEFLKIVDSI